MFISKSGSPESRGNHSLTSKCRFKNPKIHELHYLLEFKTRVNMEMKYKWIKKVV